MAIIHDPHGEYMKEWEVKIEGIKKKVKGKGKYKSRVEFKLKVIAMGLLVTLTGIVVSLPVSCQGTTRVWELSLLACWLKLNIVFPYAIGWFIILAGIYITFNGIRVERGGW